MDITSVKEVKSPMKRCGSGLERENLREKLYLF